MTVNDSNLITILTKKEIQFRAIEQEKGMPFVHIKISKNYMRLFLGPENSMIIATF